jgi:hypothetical protein
MVGFTHGTVDASVVAGVTRLSNKHGPWWHDKGLRTLNFLIFIPLMSEYVQGYDASIINNVQNLVVWQKGVLLLLYFTSLHFLRYQSGIKIGEQS